jgi:hypothetical protein
MYERRTNATPGRYRSSFLTSYHNLRAARETKISGFDPPLTAVCTAYAAPPFPPFLHPPIELSSFRPDGRLYLDRRIDNSAIRFGDLLQLIVAEVHI